MAEGAPEPAAQRQDGQIYFRLPDADAPPDWYSVAAEPSDEAHSLASLLGHPPEVEAAFEGQDEDPMRTFQDLADEGKESPTPYIIGSPLPGEPVDGRDDPVATWSTDDDGRVVEGSLVYEGEPPFSVESVVLEDIDPPARPNRPDSVMPFDQAPIADVFAESLLVTGRGEINCGVTQVNDVPQVVACIRSEVGDMTVRQWIDDVGLEGLGFPPRNCQES